MVALMTLHHTDFVSTLYAERANILSAQGLLSKRLVALDDLLAVYGANEPQPGLRADNAAQTVQPHAAVASSEALPESVESCAGGEGDRKPLPDPIPAALPGAGEVAPPPSTSPATIPEPEIPGSTETSAEAPGSEAAVDDADAAPAGEASRPDASPAPISTRQRVKQLHDEHPEYTRREAWEALGITEGSLAGHSHALGIRWKPLEPVRFERAEPPPPEDAIGPEETVTDVVQTRVGAPSRPKGTRFRLRAGRGEGKYLHMSTVGMTDNKTYAWIGTESQLVAVRRKFPEALDLYEEVVEKEPVR